MSDLHLRRRILGIDLGKARVGLAVSDELGMLAHPLETVPATDAVLCRTADTAAAKENEKSVTGLPRRLKGSMGTGAAEAVAFAEKLRGRVQCQVATWDE